MLFICILLQLVERSHDLVSLACFAGAIYSTNSTVNIDGTSVLRSNSAPFGGMGGKCLGLKAILVSPLCRLQDV